jgi:integrase
MAQELRIPKYRKHKASGLAVVTLAGKDHYLGPWKSKESKAAYRRTIAEWLAGGRQAARPSGDELTIAELFSAYWIALEAKGVPKDVLSAVSCACKPLLALYGPTPASQFGPKALKAVRVEMARVEPDGGKPLSRWVVNDRVRRIVKMFRWAAGEEHVPAAVAQAVATVEPLDRGELGVREKRKIHPVEWADVEAVLPFLSREIAALVELQWWTGARSGELVGLRPKDLDRSGEVWSLKLAQHKTAHHGHERVVYIGKNGQAALRRLLDRVPPPNAEAPIFSPARAMAAKSIQRRERRVSPLTPSQKRRRRKRNPAWRPGEVYDVGSYRRAIAHAADQANLLRVREAMAQAVPEHAEALLRLPVCAVFDVNKGALSLDPEEGTLRPRVLRACNGVEGAQAKAIEAAGEVQLVPRWHPHRLRHSAATRLRREVGIEAARVQLGHRSPAITETYAEIDRQKAVEAMARCG